MFFKLILLFITVLCSSCVMDQKEGIVVISNDTKSSVLVAKQPTQNITDKKVYSGDLDTDVLSSGEIRSIWLPLGNLKNLPDSEKVYFYFFNVDSLQKI